MQLAQWAQNTVIIRAALRAARRRDEEAAAISAYMQEKTNDRAVYKSSNSESTNRVKPSVRSQARKDLNVPTSLLRRMPGHELFHFGSELVGVYGSWCVDITIFLENSL